ncbi:hypothetical protein NQ318_018569 [Aromia moschata]|uniref:Uncharacterized protein n=1 Tax=Aromia moschata TaxID=1265417 RepID=A0AAV8ZFN4_9CUCU|nr:hypothetical protein NQ318_018569 [Aromia moschata]
MSGEPDEMVIEPGGLPDEPPPFKMPSLEQMLAAIEKMPGLSDEDRDSLREGVLNREQGAGFGGLPQGGLPQGALPQTARGSNMTVELLLLFTFVSLIVFIFVFFGYKLYKSLVERERRKEEKKRQKLQKKKK